jgi:OHCU decarboxylase
VTERAAVTVGALNALPEPDAGAFLSTCCGSTEWVRAMLARRPFASVDALLRAAEDVWWTLAPPDWLEAFARHPRIGERRAAAAQEERARSWAAEEQRGVERADEDVLAALAEANREYERRFGHIYIVCATGKTAPDMLALLRARLGNDAAAELRVAAGEQAKITRLRLLKLLGAPAPSAPASAS